jgi:virginiamycin B lyase
VWFAEYGGNKIGEISSAGVLTAEYAIPTASAQPYGITVGPDGNIWFTEFNGNKIGKMTPAGVFTEYAVPTSGGGPYGITVGPDGYLWFVTGQLPLF